MYCYRLGPRPRGDGYRDSEAHCRTCANGRLLGCGSFLLVLVKRSLIRRRLSLVVRGDEGSPFVARVRGSRRASR
jgi:hypothetical protein